MRILDEIRLAWRTAKEMEQARPFPGLFRRDCRECAHYAARVPFTVAFGDLANWAVFRCAAGRRIVTEYDKPRCGAFQRAVLDVREGKK